MQYLSPGTRLGDYEIAEVIGAGAMGVVYRARDVQLQRTVALKVLSTGSGGPIARQQLLLEARAASGLNHAGVCTVHQVDAAGGHEFIVMEFVEGGPLHKHIPPDGLRTDLVVRYGTQIADALTHAHERGVIHRDLKSSNVLVTQSGQTKIIDFGLARVLAQAASDAATRTNSDGTDAGGLAGTLAYMAPEVLNGEQFGTTSDLWSFGVLLYEMATGTMPFAGRTSFELSAQILRSPPKPLPPHVPASLRTIIGRCLEKEPAQRYRSAREISAALEAVQSDNAILLPRQPAAHPRGGQRRVAIPATLALAALLAGALWMTRFRGAESEGHGQLVQVYASDRAAHQPSISPDATMVAYVAESHGEQLDIFVSRVAGGDRVRITNDEARETYPRFSPNGERLAFARRRAGVAGPEICVVPTFGGQVSVVIPNAGQPAWSPDGSRFAFIRPGVDRNTPVALGVANVDGSNERILLRGDGVYPGVRNATWSPDGRSILFVRGTGGIAGELWMIDAAGGTPRKVSNDPRGVFSDEPVFTPDGRRIVHVSNRGGATNIWAMPLDGSAPIRLTTGSGPDESPSVAANGSIAFHNSRWRNELFVQSLAGRERRNLQRHAPYLWAPRFSPDGRELAFSRGEVDGSWHIWLTDLEGASARQLTAARGEIYPAWTPDSRYVLFHDWSPPRRVWRVAREGGPPQAMTPEGIDASYGEVSPDGKWLAFVATDNARERVYVQPIDGSAAPRALRAEPASLPRWSPDGQWIVFAPDRSYYSGIFVVRSDGTDERQLARTGGWPVWWPDGERISFITTAADGTQQIETIRAAGDRPTTVMPLRFHGLNFPFDISRDGAWLAASDSAHVSSEIWVIRN